MNWKFWTWNTEAKTKADLFAADPKKLSQLIQRSANRRNMEDLIAWSVEVLRACEERGIPDGMGVPEFIRRLERHPDQTVH